MCNCGANCLTFYEFLALAFAKQISFVSISRGKQPAYAALVGSVFHFLCASVMCICLSSLSPLAIALPGA